ncbi:MAG: polymorphic toxin-type HINT domain-containing protein [Pseudomonadota bacterium]
MLTNLLLHKNNYQYDDDRTMMIKHLNKLLVLLFYFGVHTLLNPVSGTVATDPIGTLPGHYTTSSTGAAHYTIPIQAPPGTAHMQPNLELIYNSQTGEGLLGNGWLLGGFDAITRCRVKRNGQNYPVSYGLEKEGRSDRFCLNGKLLISTGGEYGADNTKYRTEVESWKNITSHGQCGKGPCFFSVENRSGATRWFGSTSDSRIEAVFKGAQENDNALTGSVRVWALSKTMDRNFNYLRYSYNEDTQTGEYSPATITYTINEESTTPLVGTRGISFYYEPRSHNSVKYQGGAQVLHSKRLVKIATCIASSGAAELSAGCDSANAQGVSQYDFTYEENDYTGHDLLTSVSLSGSDGTQLPATRFSWQKAVKTQTNQFAFSEALSWSQDFILGWDGNSQPRRLADINGDGLSDVVGFNQQGVNYALSTATNLGNVAVKSLSSSVGNCSSGHNCLSAGPTGNSNFFPRKLADVNGDGKSDIIAFETDNVYVSLFQDNQFKDYVAWSDVLSTNNGWGSSQRSVADFNGDGLADIIGFGEQQTVYLYSNANQFVKKTRFSTTDFSEADNFTNDTGNAPMLADVNGDGLKDIVGFGSPLYNDEVVKIYVSLGTEEGFTDKQVWTDAFSLCEGAGDPNPACQSSAFPPRWTANTRRLMVDINGDGMADAVGLGDDRIRVAFSTGLSFSEPVSLFDSLLVGSDWNGTGAQRVFGDVNGDGKADIIGYTRDGGDIIFGVAEFYQANGHIALGFNTDIVAAIPPGGKLNTGNIPIDPAFSVSMTGESVAALVSFSANADSNLYVSGPPSTVGDPTCAQTKETENSNPIKSSLLIKITNGLGAETCIDYASLAGSNVTDYYTPQQPQGILSNNLQYREYRAPLYVVTQVRQSDSHGSIYTYQNRYEGSLARIDQSGFLGFQAHTRIDLQENVEAEIPGLYQTKTYQFLFADSNVAVNSARPKSEEMYIYRGGHKVTYHYTEYQLDAVATVVNPLPADSLPGQHQLGSLFVYPVEESTVNCSIIEGKTCDIDSGTGPSYTSSKAYTFDVYGRKVMEFDAGNNADPTDDLYTCTAYTPITDDTWRSFPIRNMHRTESCFDAQAPDSSMVALSCDTPSQEHINMPCTETSYQDGSRFNIDTIRHWDSSNQKWLPTVYRWNDLGMLKSRRHDYWNKTTQSYTSYATESLEYGDYRSFPIAINNGLFTTQYHYNPAYGQQTKLTDANKVSIDVMLDGFGRRVGVYNSTPDGKSSVKVASRSWGKNNAGELYRLDSHLTSWSNDKLRNSYHYFDGFSRTYRHEQNTSENKTIIEEIVYYDQKSVKQRSMPYLQGEENPEYVVHTYDSVGRISGVNYPSGDYTSLNYDILADTSGVMRSSSQSQLFNGNHQLIRNVTSLIGDHHRVIESVLPATEAMTAPVIKKYYDALGRLHTLNAADGATTELTYDSLNRPLSKESSERGIRTWTYDTRGPVETVTSATGAQITYAYDDPLLRETQRILTPEANSSLTTQILTMTYDNPTAGDFGLGRLWTVVDSAGPDLSHHYDANGNLRQKTLNINGIELFGLAFGSSAITVSRQFDPLRRATQVDFSDLQGSRLEKTYAIEGPLTEVSHCLPTTDGSDEYHCSPLTNWQNFNGFKQAQQLNYQNGMQETRAFDVLGRRQSISAMLNDSQTLLDNTYAWQSLYEILSITDTVDPSFSRTYSYTHQGYVQDVISDDSEKHYTYNIGGSLCKINTKNGQQLSDTTFGVSNQKPDGSGCDPIPSGIDDSSSYQRLVSISETDKPAQQAAYYADGTMQWIGDPNNAAEQWRYTYDPAGQLIRANGPKANSGALLPATEKYHYDYLGNLISRGRGDGSITYSIDPEYQLTLLPNYTNVGTISVQGPDGIVATISRDETQAFDIQQHTVSRTIYPRMLNENFIPAIGAVSDSFVPGSNGPGVAVAGETLFFHADPASSTTLVTGENTEGIPKEWARLNYDPFGKITHISRGTNSFAPKYHGAELSVDSGLYVIGERALLPSIGRFITPDPQLQGGPGYSPASYNAYAFSGNNPLTFVDPTGNSFLSVLKNIGIITSLVVASVVEPEVGGTLAGVYLGGAQSNHAWNPAHWNFKSWKTYMNMAAGIAFAPSGATIEVAVPAALPSELGETSTLMSGLSHSLVDAAEDDIAFAGLEGAQGKQVEGAALQKSALDSVSTGGEESAIQGSGNGQCAQASFVAGTKILTENGFVAIEQVKVGDKVWSYNEESGEVELNLVSALLNRIAAGTLLLTIDGDFIETTAEHPFYVESRGWIKAEDLRVGDDIRTYEGHSIIIDEIKLQQQPARVFNFTVDVAHNYYVSTHKVLAHNVLAHNVGAKVMGCKLFKDFFVGATRRNVEMNTAMPEAEKGNFTGVGRKLAFLKARVASGGQIGTVGRNASDVAYVGYILMGNIASEDVPAAFEEGAHLFAEQATPEMNRAFSEIEFNAYINRYRMQPNLSNTLGSSFGVESRTRILNGINYLRAL